MFNLPRFLGLTALVALAQTPLSTAPSWAAADEKEAETKAGGEGTAAKDFKTARDQGVHYLRRKMYPLARQKLEAARDLPGGETDFRTRFSLAKLYYEQFIVERAFPEAAKAVELADSDRQKRSSNALLGRMNDFFAGVTLTQAPEQKGQVEKGVIHLVDTGGLINRKKKQAFQRIATRFKKTPVKLPITIYLPFGKYTANLAPFQIEKGKTAEAVTFLYNPDTEGVSPWWYIGGGVAVATAAGVAAVVLVDSEPPARALRITRVQLNRPE